MIRQRYTTELMEAREAAMAAGLFEDNGGWSGKLRCTVCGRQGYPGGSWMDPCIDGHAPCPDCGKLVPHKTMKKHRGHATHPRSK